MIQNVAKRDNTNQTPTNKFPVRKYLQWLSPLITMLLVLLAWHWVTAMEVYPAFIVPPPSSVWESFQEAVNSGILFEHIGTTLEEMLVGLFFGVVIGLVFGYAIAKIPLLEQLLSPIIVAFQSTPIVAYAPLLIIWFGSGPTSKIVTTAVIVFFPTLINTIVGIRSVSNQLKDLMRSLNASRWQMFAQLEIPSALPMVLAGLKTSSTLAMIGAVVGEFVSAGSGLGYLVTLARNQYDTPLVIVAVLMMTVIALSLYSFVAFLEWRFLAWQRRSSR